VARRTRTRRRSARLRDGSSVVIRPIEPSDRPLLAAAFERLSAESRYRRFLRPINRLSESDLTHLTDVDHHDHEALVAISPAGELVAVARYVRDAVPDRAEAAVTVADDWQGRGLGRLLLERLADRARDERISRFTALVLAENRRALHVLESLGDTSRSPAGTEVSLDIELPPEQGLGPQLADALRAAAGGSLVLARGALTRLADAAPGERTRPASPRRATTEPVVVGTDGSETAATAVRDAAAIARAFGAPLHVVSAYRPRLGTRDDVDALLETISGSLRSDSLAVSTHAREGDAAAALLDVAEEQRAQLIVVGNRGMTGSGRYLLGSVPDRVSHHAPCNVLIVRTA
jgi:nucleotide-binding universal stress UspA family protein/GNAT superfamily N-acetyltransferase